MTVPRQSGIRFAQAGRETLCQPGAFLLEHGHSPYEFSYAQDNALWVLKVPGALLRGRLRTPDRYCALSFDASSGAGWLFASYVDLVGQQLGQQLDGGDGPARELAAQQLVDLLVCSVQADARVLSSSDSAVRAAHLCRIEDYARRHLGDRDLTPERTAQACGISTRYLHALYRDAGQTFVQWLHEQRLDRAEQDAARRARVRGQRRASMGLCRPVAFLAAVQAPLWTHAGASAPPHRLIRCAAGVTDHASSP